MKKSYPPKKEISENKEQLKRDIDRLNRLVPILDRYLTMPDNVDFDKNYDQLVQEVDELVDSLEIVTLWG